ncbi:TonB-dependent receptor [Chitinophaga horti]|uniref:TonB-dependent receptor n=1 Tax=Chitinophaga horti TaxID=2920382 RepID=A0ABY6IZE0_9BACT|nr:TonB-dependent receptor [Chitinophaga horti]UYQ91359.1 TonB-dependent receptor [Chitinophaga horti]
MTYQPNYKRVLAAAVLCLLMLPLAALAQFKISGKVTDKKNNTPVPGVVVREKGTKQGTTTGADGGYSLEVKSGDAQLLISYMGYLPQTVPVGGRSNISITIEEDVKSLNDVVIIGYQDIQRRKTTSSVASIKGKEIENTPYATFDAMLQGRVAGLSVLSTTGEPGSSSIVNVRGSTSVDPTGVSAPLYVIDGVIFDVSDISSTYAFSNPLSGINPNDIESLDILKDASASAIYGARAANGVIIVKTKRPKNGKAEFRVGTYTGVADKPAMKPIIVGAAERRMKMQLLKDMGDWFRNTNELSMMLTDSLNPAFNNATDWQGLFLKRAMINNVDVSVGQASETFAYRLSYNYYREEGVMKGFDIERSTPRLYLSLKPHKKVEISNDFFLSFVKSRHGRGDERKYPFYIWGFPSSFYKITDEDRELYTGDYEALMDDDRVQSFTGNTRIMYNIMPGLLWNTNVSFNLINSRRDYFKPAIINDGINYAENKVFQNRRYEIENYLSYNKTMGQHSITALLGQGMERQSNASTQLFGSGISVDAVKTVAGVPAGPNLTGGSFLSQRARLSFFGRFGYDFQGKYLIQANYRMDGSSRYSRDNRWGEFPSVSAGWVATDEAFMAPLKNIVSFFKIRGSYGVTGMDPGEYYAQYQPLITNAAYNGSSLDGVVRGSSAMTTYNGVTVVYPDYYNSSAARGISWERSPQYNIGIDLNLFNDRVQFTGDYYHRKSASKVFKIPVQITSGYTMVSDNYVDVLNQGLELTVNTTNLSPKSAFQWRTNFNLSLNQNMVTKLPQGGRDFKFGDPWLQRVLTVGQPLFQFSVWEVDGIYNSNEEVPVDPLSGRRISWYGGAQFGKGDPKRRDQNGDYVINDLDKVNHGNPNAKLYGGMTHSFSWKGITLDVLCTFFAGRKLWNGYLSDKLQDAGTDNPYAVWGGSSGPASQFGEGVNFWTGPNSNATYPALVTNTVDKWHIAQSLFVEDASFFRMKNIRLGYMLPEKWTSRAKLKSVRFYSMFDNVFIISNATVPDPEAVGYDGYSSGNDYPIPKKLTLGLDVIF